MYLSLSSRDWAEDDDPENDPSYLPPQTVTSNKDGTKTIISYRFNDDSKKVKTTRKIRTVVHKEKVNPAVAERRAWAKFGLEKGKPPGPSFDTTSVGENMQFRPSVNWKAQSKEDAEKAANGGGDGSEGGGGEKSLKDQLKDKKVKCRICSGEHFTARCPYKDTMAPADEATPVADPMAEDDERPAVGGLGVGGSSYVPPHLRRGGASTGDRMGGKFERDDLATLRVTNVRTRLVFDLWNLLLTQFQVSEMAEENELRDLFERFGRVTRVFLAKDRETGRAKGFAFISFMDRADAAKACSKMDGCKYSSSLSSRLIASPSFDHHHHHHQQHTNLDDPCSWIPPSDSPCGIRKEEHLDHKGFLYSSSRYPLNPEPNISSYIWSSRHYIFIIPPLPLSSLYLSS